MSTKSQWVGGMSAERVKIARKRRGLSQRAISELFGVTRSTWNNWEQGAYAPDLSTQHRLSQFLAEGVPEQLPLEFNTDRGILSPGNIRRWRLDQGLTQKKLAEMLGCSAPAVSSWEIRRYLICHKYAKKLLQLMGDVNHGAKTESESGQSAHQDESQDHSVPVHSERSPESQPLENIPTVLHRSPAPAWFLTNLEECVAVAIDSTQHGWLVRVTVNGSTREFELL